MRYWAYLNSQTLGPYELAELPKIEGFTPDLLVCPEYPPEGKPQEWVPASVVLEQLPAQEAPAKTAEPAAGEPSASPQPLPDAAQQTAQPLQASMMPAPGVEMVSASDAIAGEHGNTSQFSSGGLEIEQFPQSQPSTFEYKPEPLLQQSAAEMAMPSQEPSPKPEPAPAPEAAPALQPQAAPFEYNPSPLPSPVREIQLETFPSVEKAQPVQAAAPVSYSPAPAMSEGVLPVADSQLVQEVNKSVSEIENSLSEANKMLAEYKVLAQAVPASSGGQMEEQLQTVMGELNSFKKEVHALIEERVKLEQEILSSLASLGVQPSAGGFSAQQAAMPEEVAPVASEAAPDALPQPQEEPAVEPPQSDETSVPSREEPSQEASEPSQDEGSFDMPAFEPAAQQAEPPAASMEAAMLAPAAEPQSAAASAEAPHAAETPVAEGSAASAATPEEQSAAAAKRKKLIMIAAIVLGVIVLFLLLGKLQLLPSAINPFAKKKLPVPVMTPLSPEASPAAADVKRDVDMIALVKAWKASSSTTVEEMTTASGNVPQWKAQQDASGGWQVSAFSSSGGVPVSYVFSVSADGKILPSNKEAQGLVSRFSNATATVKDKPLPVQQPKSAAARPAARQPAAPAAAPSGEAVEAAPVQPDAAQQAAQAQPPARQRRPRPARKPRAAKPAAAAAPSPAQPAAPAVTEEIIEEEVVEEP